jgi:hypothetical protein
LPRRKPSGCRYCQTLGHAGKSDPAVVFERPCDAARPRFSAQMFFRGGSAYRAHTVRRAQGGRRPHQRLREEVRGVLGFGINGPWVNAPMGAA